MPMNFFVVRVAGLPLAESLGSGDSPLQMGALSEDVQVVRVWEQVKAPHDYLVLRGPTRADVVASTEQVGLDVLSAAEIVFEGFSDNADSVTFEQSLPDAFPEGAAYFLDVGPSASVPSPLAWCGPCEAFHRPGQHVR
jgi:hypothetical protein